MTSRSAHNRVPILLAAATALVGYALIWTCFKPIVFSATKSDFSCFYRAGRMVIAGDGSQVYDLNAQRRYDTRLGTSFVDDRGHSVSLPFVFPPYVLALFAPLGCLPYRVAEFVWYVAGVAMLLALPFVLRRSFDSKHKVVAVELLAPVCFIPAVLALMQGQPSILLLLLFAIAFAELAEGKEGRAGFVLALAILKPQLVLPMLLALVIWRKWRTLEALAWSCTGLLGVSMALVGWRATFYYPRALVEFNRLAGSLGGEHPESMPDLRGCLYILFQTHFSGATLARITITLSILLLLILAVLLKRHPTLSTTSYSLVVVVTLLLSYHAYLHDTSLLLLPFLLMAQRMRHSRWTMNHGAMAAAIAALYVVPLLPTSLSATALQAFAVMAMLATSLGVEVRIESGAQSTEAAESRFCNTPALSR